LNVWLGLATLEFNLTCDMKSAGYCVNMVVLFLQSSRNSSSWKLWGMLLITVWGLMFCLMVDLVS